MLFAAPHPVGAAPWAAADGSRAAETACLARARHLGEARTDAHGSGAVEAGGSATVQHLKQLAPASRVEHPRLPHTRARMVCRRRVRLCLVCTTACALCVSHPLGVPGRAADGASRGHGSKRATLAASLDHASLTVPCDRALSAAIGTSRRCLRPSSCGRRTSLITYDHAGAAGTAAAASALAVEAIER